MTHLRTLFYQSAKGDSKSADDKQLDSFLHADRADKIPPIHELVTLLIRQQKGSLAVLTESKMAEYVDDYVNKKDLDSIADGVEKSIKHMAASMKSEPGLADKDVVRSDDVERMIRKKHSEMTAQGQRDAHTTTAVRLRVQPRTILTMCMSL